MIQLCVADFRESPKSPILNTKMVGGTGHYLNRPAAPNACLLEILGEALIAGVLAIVKKF